jgi:hypothetical protein
MSFMPVNPWGLIDIQQPTFWEFYFSCPPLMLFSTTANIAQSVDHDGSN